MTGAFPAAIMGLGAGLMVIGLGPGLMAIGLGPGLMTIGLGPGLMAIGLGAGLMAIGLGAGLMAIGLGAGLIMTIDTGDPESITLGGGVSTRVSRPTPTRALSTGRGEGETFGPLL